MATPYRILTTLKFDLSSQNCVFVADTHPDDTLSGYSAVSIIRHPDEKCTIGVSREALQLELWAAAAGLTIAEGPMTFSSLVVRTPSPQWFDSFKFTLLQAVLEDCAAALCHYAGVGMGLSLWGAWDSSAPTSIILSLASGAQRLESPHDCVLSQTERISGVYITSLPRRRNILRRPQSDRRLLSAPSVHVSRVGVKRRRSIDSQDGAASFVNIPGAPLYAEDPLLFETLGDGLSPLLSTDPCAFLGSVTPHPVVLSDAVLANAYAMASVSLPGLSSQLLSIGSSESSTSSASNREPKRPRGSVTPLHTSVSVLLASLQRPHTRPAVASAALSRSSVPLPAVSSIRSTPAGSTSSGLDDGDERDDETSGLLINATPSSASGRLNAGSTTLISTGRATTGTSPGADSLLDAHRITQESSRPVAFAGSFGQIISHASAPTDDVSLRDWQRQTAQQLSDVEALSGLGPLLLTGFPTTVTVEQVIVPDYYKSTDVTARSQENLKRPATVDADEAAYVTSKTNVSPAGLVAPPSALAPPLVFATLDVPLSVAFRVSPPPVLPPPPVAAAAAAPLGRLKLFLPLRVSNSAEIMQSARGASLFVNAPAIVDILAVVAAEYTTAKPRNDPTLMGVDYASSQSSNVQQIRRALRPEETAVLQKKCNSKLNSDSSLQLLTSNCDVSLEPVLVGVLRSAAELHGSVYPVPLPLSERMPIFPLDCAAAMQRAAARCVGVVGNRIQSPDLFFSNDWIALLRHFPALVQVARADLRPHPPLQFSGSLLTDNVNSFGGGILHAHDHTAAFNVPQLQEGCSLEGTCDGDGSAPATFMQHMLALTMNTYR